MEDDRPILKEMVGDSQAMRNVYRLTRRAASSSSTVLLTGETGTGKELIAKAIHELSPRATGPFIRVNCGALSESLLESELFGHIKGAFTSAVENRTGRFEAAHGGTIFLDEINSVSFTLQVKLLRVLQEHEFERVGDTRSIQVDCRIVAATNRNLLDEIEAGRFREDLYYRLNVIPVDLPPLRNRSEDIPELLHFFAKQFSAAEEIPLPDFSDEVLSTFKNYSWPGNVRELQNYVERLIVLSGEDGLSLDLLPGHVTGKSASRSHASQTLDPETLCRELVRLELQEVGDSSTNVHTHVVSQVEKELILQVLRSCQGVQTKTATRLGINRNTLHKKISEYELESEAR
ncbi:sigma-54 dependent transcriptional regulator [uncultured Gimesia sp.]|uniref:sigma-54 interaction domain-containing protein n=1 Tax=uncultured Gimesia sp. TaxID=1678688 RepID=UPI0026024426|nr:sigma-54 dependent transcriptional regulator [uncultured Gimesia sp.]